MNSSIQEVVMNDRRTVFLSIILGIGIGACLALSSWLANPEAAQAQQCRQLYLAQCTSGSGCPCPGGNARVSFTPSDTQPNPDYYLYLCER